MACFIGLFFFMIPNANAFEPTPPFPRIAAWLQDIDATGEPLDHLAKYDSVLVPANVKLGTLQELRNKNLDNLLLPHYGFCGIVPPSGWGNPNFYEDCWNPDTPLVYDNNFVQCELYRWVEDNSCWLNNADGQHFYTWDNLWGASMTLFCPLDSDNRQYQHFYADLLNDAVFLKIKDVPQVDYFDGVHFDCAGSPYWTSDAWENYYDGEGHPPDADGNGIPDEENQFNSWWSAGGVQLFSRLREYAGDEHFIHINGGGDWLPYVNGFQIENLLGGRVFWQPYECPPGETNCDPYQWMRALFRPTNGYIHRLAAVYPLPFNRFWVDVHWKCGSGRDATACCNGVQCAPGQQPTEADQQEFHRVKRFGFATGLLGDADINFMKKDPPNNEFWWIPEYDNGGAQRYYLGYPQGPCKVIEDNGALTQCRDTWPPKVYRRDYDSGMVLVNPGYDEKTVALPEPYKILDVTEYFTAEGGAIVSSVVLPPTDGVILLKVTEPILQCTQGALIVETCMCGNDVIEPDGETFCCTVPGSVKREPFDPCDDDSDCDDGDPASQDECMAPLTCQAVCFYTPIEDVCIDGDDQCPEECDSSNDNDCPSVTDTPTPTVTITPTPEPCSVEGEEEVCDVSGCGGTRVCGSGFWSVCVKNDLCCGIDCDDGNSCTSDSCSDGACSHANICGDDGGYTGGTTGTSTPTTAPTPTSGTGTDTPSPTVDWQGFEPEV
ncbi:hypothetical protein KJ765_03945, partial [Candidatus Micrarchaeota archaeon]|nr:hypothetical protein [Candidatus Micrarchaeota archaeon]